MNNQKNSASASVVVGGLAVKVKNVVFDCDFAENISEESALSLLRREKYNNSLK